jgi:hypothetical protein
MDVLIRGYPDLNTIVKKISMTVLGTVLITLVIPSALAEAQANFQVQGSEWYRSDTNNLSSGTYPAQYGGHVSILNPLGTGTILGNITYRIDAENISSYDDMQSQKNRREK